MKKQSNMYLKQIVYVLMLLTYTIAYSQTNHCENCNGSGKSKCFMCKGTKYQTITRYDGGTTKVPCRYCQMTGEAMCVICNGSGRHNDQTNNTNLYQNTTILNNGNSTVKNNGNSSSYVKCSRCGGTGVCKSCGNRRGSWEYVDHYTGSGKKAWINCGECNGSKHCRICHGKGRL